MSMKYRLGRLPLGLAPQTRNSLFRIRRTILLEGPQSMHTLCGLVVASDARMPGDGGVSDEAARIDFIRYCIENDWLRPVHTEDHEVAVGISHERKFERHLGR